MDCPATFSSARVSSTSAGTTGILVVRPKRQFRIALLFREARFHIESKPAGLAGAYVVGLAFAFGWTPCVGPVLAAVLFVAGSEETIWQGTSLLAIYSAGLGVPFLAAAFAAGPFLNLMRRFRGGVRIVERLLGAPVLCRDRAVEILALESGRDEPTLGVLPGRSSGPAAR